MNPTRVWAKNFRTYETVEWDIPQGLTAIVGRNTVTDGSDSNGSGKSSLLELLPISLFGPPMPWSEYLTAGGEAESCEVGCELEHAGERYRIRRTFSAKGRGSSKLDFERWKDAPENSGDDTGPMWTPLTRGTQQDTQEYILQVLGLSESVFSHSVYAAQGARHFADPSLPPRERKQIMAEALGLDAWDEKLELVRADLSETRGEITAIETRLGAFAEDVAALPGLKTVHILLVEDAAAASCTLAETETLAEETAAQYAAHLAEIAAYDGLVATRAAAGAVVVALGDRIRQANDAIDTRKALSDELMQLKAKASGAEQLQGIVSGQEQAAAEHAAAVKERERLTVEQDALRDRVRKLIGEESGHTAKGNEIVVAMSKLAEAAVGVCDHCGQAIQGASKEASLASMERDKAALFAKAEELRAEIEKAIEQGKTYAPLLHELEVKIGSAPSGDLVAGMKLAEARQAERDLAALQERAHHLEEVAATLTTELQAEHEQAKVVLAGASAAVQAGGPKASGIDWNASRDHVASQLGMAKSADNQARTALATSEEKLRNLEELAGRSEEALLAKGLLEGRLDHLKQMETAYGRNGVPALLMEALAIPQVEREASRVLEQLGVPFRIELVTQAEKKSGGLKDTLDVVVHGPDGPLRFESYSGGEQTRLAFALRVAFARLIAGQRGSEIGVLMLDELVFMDATGLAAVAEVLKGLTEFRSIVLVSHDERLVDSFDSVVTVVRDESGSRLEAA